MPVSTTEVPDDVPSLGKVGERNHLPPSEDTVSTAPPSTLTRAPKKAAPPATPTAVATPTMPPSAPRPPVATVPSVSKPAPPTVRGGSSGVLPVPVHVDPTTVAKPPAKARDWHEPLDARELFNLSHLSSTETRAALPSVVPLPTLNSATGRTRYLLDAPIPVVYPESRADTWPTKYGMKYEEIAGLPFDIPQMSNLIKTISSSKEAIIGIPVGSKLGGMASGADAVQVDRTGCIRTAFAAYTGTYFAANEYEPVFTISDEELATYTGLHPSEGDPVTATTEADAAEALRRAVAEADRLNQQDDESTPGAPLSATVHTAPKDYTKPFYRPNGSKYIPRKVVTGGLMRSRATIYDVEAIEKAYAALIPVLLKGPPGTGKTSLAETALPNLVTINGTAETEVPDFIGSYVQHGDKFVWVDGPLLVAMKNGWPLLVDEIALIESRVVATLYPLMDGRGELMVTSNPELGVIQAEPGFYIIGACNPDVQGAVLSDALLSRFSIQIEVTTDYDILKGLDVDANVITVAKALQTEKESGALSRAPQTRELLDFQRVKNVFGESMALSNLIATADLDDRESYIRKINSTFGTKVTSLKL